MPEAGEESRLLKSVRLELRERRRGRRIALEGALITETELGLSEETRKLAEVDGHVVRLYDLGSPFSLLKDDVMRAIEDILSKKIGDDALDLSPLEHNSELVVSNDGAWFYPDMPEKLMSYVIVVGMEDVYVSRETREFFVRSSTLDDYLRLRAEAGMPVFPADPEEYLVRELPPDAEEAVVIDLRSHCGLVIFTTEDREFGVDFPVRPPVGEFSGGGPLAWDAGTTLHRFVYRTEDLMIVFDSRLGFLDLSPILEEALRGNADSAKALSLLNDGSDKRMISINEANRWLIDALGSAEPLPFVYRQALPEQLIRTFLRYTRGIWSSQEEDGVSAAIFTIPGGVLGFLVFHDGNTMLACAGQSPDRILESLQDALSRAEESAAVITSLPDDLLDVLLARDGRPGETIATTLIVNGLTANLVNRVAFDPSFTMFLREVWAREIGDDEGEGTTLGAREEETQNV